MGMVVVADSRHAARFISIDCRLIVGMVVTVAVMPEMYGVARSVLQRIADAHHRRVSGIQREHDGKNKREESAHGGEAYPNECLV